MNQKHPEIVAAIESDNFHFREWLSEGGDLTLNEVVFEWISCDRENSSQIALFKVGDKYFRLVGSYDSWNGSEFYSLTDFQEVKPVQKTITVYETVE